jgi:hypothetical protein
MKLKWTAAVAGGAVAGFAFGGGYAAADDTETQAPDTQTFQVSASAASPLGSPMKLKVKGTSWYPHLAAAGVGGATSVDSPVSVASPAGFDSPASPASPGSPGVSVNSPASPSGTNNGASANSPASPASVNNDVSANSPAPAPAPSQGSASGGGSGS